MVTLVTILWNCVKLTHNSLDVTSYTNKTRPRRNYLSLACIVLKIPYDIGHVYSPYHIIPFDTISDLPV